MTLGSKKGWKSIVPLRLKCKSTPRFCLFSKVKPANYGPGKTPVYLNVYDLTPMNGYVYWAGLGIFHSGVEGKGFYMLICIAIMNLPLSMKKHPLLISVWCFLQYALSLYQLFLVQFPNFI